MAPRISTSPALIISAALVSAAGLSFAACARSCSSRSAGASMRPLAAGLGHGLHDDQVAQPVEQVGGEPARVVPGLDHVVDRVEHGRAVPGRERLDHLIQQPVVGVAQQRDGAVVAQALLVRAGDELVEHRQRVADRARSGPDDDREHGRLVGHALADQDLLQMLPQHRRGHEPERVVVGSGPDRRDDLFRLSRREDELQVRRRLLDELQQRVEALPGDHVGLVDDVDLEAARHRGVEGAFAQVPGVIDAAVRRGVDLDHVDAPRPGRGQRHARGADPAGVGGGTLLAVQRPGQDPRAGGLAAAPRAAEQVRVMDPAAAQRLPQRLRDLVLALDLGEAAWPVAAVEGQRGAGRSRVRSAVRVTGTGGVACHDLILPKIRTPRTPDRARVPLLPSGPGGVGGMNAVRGVWQPV